MIYTIAGVALLLSPVALVITIVLAVLKKTVWKKSLIVTLSLFGTAMVIGFGGRLYQYNEEIVYGIGCVFAPVCLFAVLHKASKNANKARKLVGNIVEIEKERTVKTTIVDSSHTVTSRTSTGSAVGRAVVGGAIFGGIGALVGATTAKQKSIEKHSTTFLVYYNDGNRTHKTVKNGSELYEIYMSRLEDK